MTASMPLTDDQRSSLGELYESNHAALLRLCTRILRDPEEAADACQDVFIVAAREFATGTPPPNPRAWLQVVARNHCLDVLRRRKRFGRALTTMGSSLDDHADPEATVIGRQSVDSVLRGLSPRERLALWQSAVERRPLANIATGLRLNYMAAAQVLSRARRHAALAMARVATILAGLRVYRSLTRSAGVTRSALVTHSIQLVALVALPVAVATIQPSSSPTASSPAQTETPSFTGHGQATIVAGTDHRGTAGLGIGSAVRPLAPLPGSPAGLSSVPSIDNSVLNQLINIAPSLARGLPLVPVVPVSATSSPVPKVR